MELVTFLVERRGELGAMIGQHVFLVLVSTGVAVALGVPLGLYLTRRPALARPVIGFASVMQTVPSLALFGFLIPIPVLGGIGNRTAIVALVLYALLLRMKLVPRWISHWGLWAAVLLLVGTLLDQLDLLSGVPDASLEFILAGPIAVNEMVLAVWLIAKGFNESEVKHENRSV